MLPDTLFLLSVYVRLNSAESSGMKSVCDERFSCHLPCHIEVAFLMMRIEVETVEGENNVCFCFISLAGGLECAMKKCRLAVIATSAGFIFGTHIIYTAEHMATVNKQMLSLCACEKQQTENHFFFSLSLAVLSMPRLPRLSSNQKYILH